MKVTVTGNTWTQTWNMWTFHLCVQNHIVHQHGRGSETWLWLRDLTKVQRRRQESPDLWPGVQTYRCQTEVWIVNIWNMETCFGPMSPNLSWCDVWMLLLFWVCLAASGTGTSNLQRICGRSEKVCNDLDVLEQTNSQESWSFKRQVPTFKLGGLGAWGSCAAS